MPQFGTMKQLDTMTYPDTAPYEDGELASARFWEPSGLSLAGRRLYVADTNNHAIRLVDVDAGTVRTLEIRGA